MEPSDPGRSWLCQHRPNNRVSQYFPVGLWHPGEMSLSIRPYHYLMLRYLGAQEVERV